jgi:hypothetical protein
MAGNWHDQDQGTKHDLYDIETGHLEANARRTPPMTADTMTPDPAVEAQEVVKASANSGPGPLQRLGDQEWQILCEKDDRTSPPEYPEMLLITRNELGAAMAEAYILAKDQNREALSTAHAAGEAQMKERAAKWHDAEADKFSARLARQAKRSMEIGPRGQAEDGEVERLRGNDGGNEQMATEFAILFRPYEGSGP